MGSYAVYTVPGLGGSGDAHWQTLWERAHPGWRRVTQKDWDTPDLEGWAQKVVQAVATAAPRRVVLVAHSFGCLAVARAAAALRNRVAGALLVAPADPRRFGAQSAVARKLGFPAVVAASRNDPWLDWARAAPLAGQWQAEFVDLGACGHVNAEAGFGPWPTGEALLAGLVDGVK